MMTKTRKPRTVVGCQSCGTKTGPFSYGPEFCNDCSHLFGALASGWSPVAQLLEVEVEVFPVELSELPVGAELELAELLVGLLDLEPEPPPGCSC